MSNRDKQNSSESVSNKSSSPDIQQNKLEKEMNKIIRSYNLLDPSGIAKLAFDKKKCRKFFLIQKIQRLKLSQKLSNYKTYSNKKEKKQKQEKYYQNESKYSEFDEIFQKFGKKDSMDVRFRKIMRRKLQMTYLKDQELRKKIWKTASLAQYQQNIYTKQNYYKQLLKFNNFPDYFNVTINLDVSRTFNTNQIMPIQEKRAKLLNILQCYSKRNSNIGYCQGMNFIVAFLLDCQYTEEECFWILVQLVEQILPIDYYTSFMLGIICDQKIFNELLQIHNPEVYEILEKNEISTGLFIIQWFVCLFTQAFKEMEVVKVIFDLLFTKGSIILFKAALVIIDYCKHFIKKCKDPFQIIQVIQQETANISDAKWFQEQINKIYVSQKATNLLREVYRSIHFDEFQKEQKVKPILRKKFQCNKDWPICIYKLEMDKINQLNNDLNIILQPQYNIDKCLIQNYFDNPKQRNPETYFQNNPQTVISSDAQFTQQQQQQQQLPQQQQQYYQISQQQDQQQEQKQQITTIENIQAIKQQQLVEQDEKQNQEAGQQQINNQNSNQQNMIEQVSTSSSLQNNINEQKFIEFSDEDEQEILIVRFKYHLCDQLQDKIVKQQESILQSIEIKSSEKDQNEQILQEENANQEENKNQLQNENIQINDQENKNLQQILQEANSIQAFTQILINEKQSFKIEDFFSEDFQQQEQKKDNSQTDFLQQSVEFIRRVSINNKVFSKLMFGERSGQESRLNYSKTSISEQQQQKEYIKSYIDS